MFILSTTLSILLGGRGPLENAFVCLRAHARKYSRRLRLKRRSNMAALSVVAMAAVITRARL